VSFVCAALGLGPLIGACATPSGAAAPALARDTMPEAPSTRQTRLVFELSNGVTAILEEDHVAPVVALQAWVAGVLATEPTGQSGLAHLTERIVLAGARADGDAAPITAWTTVDATVFETVVAAPVAAGRLGTMAAMVARAGFDAAEVDRARADALGERRRAAASPLDSATNAVLAAAFAGQGYGRPVLGDEPSLRALTPADVAAFHARAYAGARVTVVAVGDFDAEALRARVTAAFGSLPKGAAAPAAAAPPAPGPAATVLASEGGGHLVIALRLGARGPRELASAGVLAAALARGGEGRLPRELIRNRQLASSARARVFRARDASLLVLDAALVSGRVEEAARVTLAELARARRELSAAELEVARAVVETDLARGGETAAGRARKLGFVAVTSGATFDDRYAEALRALEPDDVRASTEALVRPENIFMAVAAPGQGASTPERLRVLAAVVAAEPRSASAPLAKATGGIPRFVLPSGVRVLVLRVPGAGSVAAHAEWSGGLRLEDARSNGATSLLAALLPRGTRTRDAARLAEDLEGMGGTLTGTAGRDDLGLTATFLARRWEDGLALLADCLRHPAFAEDEVEAARRTALERVRAHEDDADVAAARLYAATLWPGHSYRLPLVGTASSLSGLTRRRLADHFQRFYGAANLTIAVVGDVDPGRVAETLAARLSDAPAPLEGAPPAPPARVPTDAPTEVFAVAAKDEAHVVVGYPGLALRDPERRAAEVLVEILGGREDVRGGRLARELGGVSLVDASTWSGVDGGALVFDLASTPASIDAAVEALRGALARAVATPFTPVEVERARAALVSASALSLESRAAVAEALSRDEALGLPVGSYRRAAAELAAVTPEAVSRVARRLVDPRLEVVAVVRPPLAPTVAKAAPAKLGPRSASGPTPTSSRGGARPPAP
jgi:zinc protease